MSLLHFLAINPQDLRQRRSILRRCLKNCSKTHARTERAKSTHLHLEVLLGLYNSAAAAVDKVPIYYIGCTVAAGPSEAWFIEAHDSFKSIENTDTLTAKNPAVKSEMATLDGVDGELRSNSTTMVAVLRDDLTYRAEQFAKELPKSRYFSMTILRVRPYSDPRFAELGKQVISASEKAGNELPTAVFQVVSGGPGGMYLLFSPMKSMETMDEAPIRSKAMMAAMGMDHAAALYKNAGEIITNVQPMLLAINPKMTRESHRRLRRQWDRRSS